MATSSPIRIDDEVHASARLAAAVMSRSTAQQIAHWARLGRELELSQTISHSDIAAVLGGRRSYDDLNKHEQAVVRTEWTEQMTARREALNLEQRFGAEGRSYVELGTDGDIVTVAAST